MNDSLGAELAAELIIVKARNQNYCLDLASVREINPAQGLRLNDYSDNPYGWLAVHDQTIPTFVLSWLIQGVCVGDPAKGRVLQIDRDEQTFGLVVDSFDYSDASTQVCFFPLPAAVRGPRAHYTRGVANVGGELMLYLAAERLDSGPIVSLKADAQPTCAKSVNVSPIRSGELLLRFAECTSGEDEATVQLAVAMDRVCEIIENPKIVPVHETPAHVSGLAQWRGMPVPVVHMGLGLGLNSPASESVERLIVVRVGEGDELLALVSNRKPQVSKVDAPAEPAFSQLGEKLALLRGGFREAGNLVIVPDLRAVLDAPVDIRLPVLV